MPGLMALLPMMVALLVTLPLVMLPFPGRSLAARLQVYDVPLGTEPLRMDVVRWNGRADVATVARFLEGGGASRLEMRLVRLEAGRTSVVRTWTPPPGTVYAEPVQAPGLGPAWLVLDKTGWRLGRGEPGRVLWTPLCRCATAILPFGPGREDVRDFARDVDGQPGDEILLPFPDHLAAYRLNLAPLALVPLWRAYWNQDRSPLATEGKAHIVPRFHLESTGKPAGIALVRFRGDHILLAQPGTREKGSISITAAGKEALLEYAQAKGWPEDLLGDLAVLSPGRYQNAAGILKALAGGKEEENESWTPFLPDVLARLAPGPEAAVPRRVALGGLGAVDPEDDRLRLMALTDMDGDGRLDLLHAKLVNFGSVFKQKNQLRWYRGVAGDRPFGFAPPVQLIESDAGSFAEVVHPRVDDLPPLALLLATTEVSFSSVMKALSSQKVALTMRILPWRNGGLGAAPLARGDFTYDDLTKGGRRAMFLLADLDGDGQRDYLANFQAGVLSVFLARQGAGNLSTPSLSHGGLPLPSHPSRVVIGDLDGDGREELVMRYQEKHHGALGKYLRIVRYRP